MPSGETTSEPKLQRPVESLTPGGSHSSNANVTSAPHEIGHSATMTPVESAAIPSSDPLVGTIVADRYRLLERVGEGGMGAVYRGEHVLLRKRVAVKFLHAEMSRIAEVVVRFEREAIAAANLEHPNVVAAHDYGKTHDGVFFLVMEFVDGGSLRSLLAREPRLPPTRALHIARHIAAALNRAHSLGIVHRDLKPENIVLVERDGDVDFAKVIDFGIAKVSAGRLGDGAPALTQVGMIYGTPDYMAPEQALGGNIDHRADLYAFGIVLFEMLVGSRPFESDDVMTLLGKHMTAEPPSASSMAPRGVLPVAIDAVFAKILAKSPTERFDSALEMLSALERALGVSIPPMGTVPPGTFPARGSNQPNADPYTARALFTAASSSLRGTTRNIPSAINSWPHAARSALSTLSLDLRALKNHPRHAGKVIGAIGAMALLSCVIAMATRSSTGQSANIVSTPTPIVPHSISSHPAAVQNNSATPSTSLHASNTTSLPSLAHTDQVAAGPGLPPALARRLEEYEARPNVRMLLDSARGRDRGAVITAFETTRAQSPDDPIVNYLLGTLYARERSRKASALDRYTDAVRVEPGFGQDPTLARDVVDIYLNVRDLAEHAFALISGPLAATAAPVILDAALTSHNPAVRRNAATLLLSPSFASSLDTTTRALIELSSARTCEQKLNPVRALGASGDGRALPYLHAIPTDYRCGGFFRRVQCNACLATELPQAIQAIQNRAH